MAWSTPPTFTSGQVVTHTNLNVLSADLSALSQHTHTGTDGDGADVFVPEFVAGRRISLIKNFATAAAVASVRDAGNDWRYVQLQSTGAIVSVSFTDDIVNMSHLPELSCGFAAVNGTNTEVITFGFSNAPGAATLPTSCVYFRLTNAGSFGTWEAVTRAAGTPTATSTGVTGGTTPKWFKIKVVSTSSVEFYIENTLVATNTTALPASTVDMYPNFNVDHNGTNSQGWFSQYVGFSQVPRV